MTVQYITPDQAAAERGVRTDAIYMAVKRKHLPAVKQDGMILITTSDWEHYQTYHKKRNQNPDNSIGKAKGRRFTKVQTQSKLRSECMGCPNINFDANKLQFKCSVYHNPLAVLLDQWEFCKSFGKKVDIE
ncbi:MAG: hypothetical protein ACYC27_03035 [Armatimonadota bacterium]